MNSTLRHASTLYRKERVWIVPNAPENVFVCELAPNKKRPLWMLFPFYYMYMLNSPSYFQDAASQTGAGLNVSPLDETCIYCNAQT